MGKNALDSVPEMVRSIAECLICICTHVVTKTLLLLVVLALDYDTGTQWQLQLSVSKKTFILLGNEKLKNVRECCSIQLNQITNKANTMSILANQSLCVKFNISENIIKNIIKFHSNHSNKLKPLTRLVTMAVSSLYLHLLQISNF